ncbi:hypothetical protein [Streptomyces sirii]|uniref:hypothetical protein n=1 Tax=Streptomyces sirii TaxID=3127701 RepID=UPI003D36B4BE
MAVAVGIRQPATATGVGGGRWPSHLYEAPVDHSSITRRQPRNSPYTRPMINKAISAVIAGATLLAPAYGDRPADDWRRVGDGITSGISGIVVDGRHGNTVDTLAVRDNKEPGQQRLVVVRYSPHAKPQVRAVEWRGGQPVDLEAIDAVPGRDREYVALASDGTAYRIRREKDTVLRENGAIRRVRDTVRVIRKFQLPGISPDGNYEGFTLSRTAHGAIVAVWADRGGDDRPAKLTAATWNPATGTFGKRDSAEFSAPYPAENVRHVSDVELSARGGLTVSSASDPGDDGPYDSALYAAGRLVVRGDGKVELRLSGTPDRLATFAGHKIEALACLPGSSTGILGTDDENDGGSVTTAAFCRP